MSETVLKCFCNQSNLIFLSHIISKTVDYQRQFYPVTYIER